MTMLLIIPDITNSFWSEVARGAQDILDKAGYNLILANSDWQAGRELRYLGMARSFMVDAVLINAPGIDIEKLEELSCPIVVLGDRTDIIPYPLVGTDTYHAIKDALAFCYDRGHQRIAMVHPHGADGEGMSRIRYQAYKDFHMEKGLPFDESLISYAPLTVESGIEGADLFLARKGKPTAILTGNDLVAIGLLQAFQSKGISVPEDVSLIGMDDIPAANMVVPRITTVQKPQRQIGMTAARLALDLVDGKEVAKRTLLPAKIVERETVRRLS